MVSYLPGSNDNLTSTEQGGEYLALKSIHALELVRSQVSQEVHLYNQGKDKLGVQNRILFKGDWTVSTADLRGDTMKLIHVSHLVIETDLRGTKNYISQPSMN